MSSFAWRRSKHRTTASVRRYDEDLLMDESRMFRINGMTEIILSIFSGIWIDRPVIEKSCIVMNYEVFRYWAGET
jgi:hypothetical protein